MMKVSDPIIFGHAVSVYYKDVLAKHADTLKQIGFDPNNGIGDLYAKMAEPARRQARRHRSGPEGRIRAAARAWPW